jgi:hypothetical protein
MRSTHILWLIENDPGCPLLGLPDCELNPRLDADAHTLAADLWSRQVSLHESDSWVLSNAAAFFVFHDRERSEELLKMAREIEPENPVFARMVAGLFLRRASGVSEVNRRADGKKALDELERMVAAEPKRERKWPLFADLAEAALLAQHWEKSRAYAEKVLEEACEGRNLADKVRGLHRGNLILGRIALALGDATSAKMYLIRAADIPVPQIMGRFDPFMKLAEELLAKGERDAVLEYLEKCSTRWTTTDHRLELWIQAMKRNEIPSFGPSTIH